VRRSSGRVALHYDCARRPVRCDRINVRAPPHSSNNSCTREHTELIGEAADTTGGTRLDTQVEGPEGCADNVAGAVVDVGARRRCHRVAHFRRGD
jgi:hypothetical protein